MTSVQGQIESALMNISPQHDNPVGLMHPYWARKPLNVIEALVEVLSKPGDLVVDPFMGSGTTVIAALRKTRCVFASDLSPLSVFMVKSILDISRRYPESIDFLEEYVSAIEKQVLPWFAHENGGYVERIRYAVDGSFENGNFRLRPSELISKKRTGNRWTTRRVCSIEGWKEHDLEYKKFQNNPVSFDDIPLRANSRIAIPRGAKLAHYYTPMNRASINIALQIARDYVADWKRGAALFLLSASLPLLRLSDKKASSQWPYWRPKKLLTSRNPIVVFHQRLDAICKGSEWTRSALAITKEVPIEALSGGKSSMYSIHQIPAQHLNGYANRIGQAALLLTDPPYVDHAPYLEYADCWMKILGLPHPPNIHNEEIVKTDAPSRREDSDQYLDRLHEAFSSASRLVKPNGFFAFFYQDIDLRHWRVILSCLTNEGFSHICTVGIPKQRRSIKTVTSPGRTLDGDLITVFIKRKVNKSAQQSVCMNDLGKLLIDIARKPNRSLFDLYTKVIDFGFRHACFDALIKIGSDVRDIIRSFTKEGL